MQRLLTVDLGNSRCKLLLWTRAEPPTAGEGAELAVDDELLARAAAWLGEHGPVDLTVLSSVADAEREAALVRALEEHGGEVLRGPDAGLDVRCRVPAEVGRDRLYAARGALELGGGSALVCDCGTALTVDAVRAEAGAPPAFLGGAIAPGPELLARALSAGTARLSAIRPRPVARALGRDTEEALLAGVVRGLRGAARGLVDDVAREARLEEAPVFVTGGARALLLEPEPFTTRELRVEPMLVHRGLLHAGLARVP